jgi:hypothetical protein
MIPVASAILTICEEDVVCIGMCDDCNHIERVGVRITQKSISYDDTEKHQQPSLWINNCNI